MLTELRVREMRHAQVRVLQLVTETGMLTVVRQLECNCLESMIRPVWHVSKSVSQVVR